MGKRWKLHQSTVLVSGLCAALLMPSLWLDANADAAAPPGVPVQRLSSTLEGHQVTGASTDGNASADGRWAVFVSRASELGATTDRSVVVLVDVANKVASRFGTIPSGSILQARISPDGSIIAYVENRALRVANRQTGATTTVTRHDGDPLMVDPRGLFFSANSRYLMFSNTDYGDTGTSYAQAAVYDTQKKTYENVSLNNQGKLAQWYAYPRLLSPDGRYAYFISASPNLPDAGSQGHGSRLYRRDTQLDRTVPFSLPGGNSWHLNNLSQNGRYLARVDGGNIGLVDIETGKYSTVQLPGEVASHWCQQFSTAVYPSNDAQRFYISACQASPYSTGVLWYFDRHRNSATRVAGPQVGNVTPYGDLQGVVFDTSEGSTWNNDANDTEDVYISGTMSTPIVDCGDATVIGVRGSGDNANGIDSPGLLASSVASRLQHDWKLKLYDDDGAKRELGTLTVNITGLSYPAAEASWKEGMAYGVSVDSGRTSLSALLGRIRTLCGTSLPILLVGYSQGAHVIQDALSELSSKATRGDPTWASVRGVVLFGSPRFNPNDASARGTFIKDYPSGGVLGSPEIPSRYKDRVRAYCVADDGICLTGNTPGPHTWAYEDKAVLGDAAGFLAWQAGRSKRIASKPTVALDVVRDNRRGMMLTRVSAAAVYRNGPPSVKYQWDWTSDGRIDVTTGLPWSSHNYSLKRGRFYATVTIRFADNTSIKRKLCIQRERRVDKAC